MKAQDNKKEQATDVYTLLGTVDEFHTKTCHELVSIVKKHEKQKMDEVPEFMDMLKAIEILKKLYPKLSKK